MEKNLVEKKIKWEETTNRFVIFLDIMGFKDLVARNSHAKIYDLMVTISKAKDEIQGLLNKGISEEHLGKTIYTTTFSDSIVLFSSDDSIESFEMVSSAAAFIFITAINHSIPIKGAMAHGTLTVDKKKHIYFGQPLIDSYLLQEELYYYGIICHNSIDGFINNNRKQFDKSPIHDYIIEIRTPLKSGVITHSNLNWFAATKVYGESDKVIPLKFQDNITRLKSITSGNPRKYIDNTIEVFNFLYQI